MTEIEKEPTSKERAAEAIQPWKMIGLVGGGAVGLAVGSSALAAGVNGVTSRVRDAFQSFMDREQDYNATLVEVRQAERSNPIAQKLRQAMDKISELSTSLTQAHERNTTLESQNRQLSERVQALEVQLNEERQRSPEQEVQQVRKATSSPQP